MKLRKTIDPSLQHKMDFHWQYWELVGRRTTTADFLKDKRLPPDERLFLILRKEFITVEEAKRISFFCVRATGSVLKKELKEACTLLDANSALATRRKASELNGLASSGRQLTDYDSVVFYTRQMADSHDMAWAFHATHEAASIIDGEKICRALRRIILERVEKRRSGGYVEQPKGSVSR